MKRPTAAWLPYVGVACLLGGWLIQYGADKARHEALEASVRKLEAKQLVDDSINYQEHSKYWPQILAAENTR